MNQHYMLLMHLLATWESDNTIVVDFNSCTKLNAYTGWFDLQINSVEQGRQIVGVPALTDACRRMPTSTGTIRFSPQLLTLD